MDDLIEFSNLRKEISFFLKEISFFLKEKKIRLRPSVFFFGLFFRKCLMLFSMLFGSVLLTLTNLRNFPEKMRIRFPRGQLTSRNPGLNTGI